MDTERTSAEVNAALAEVRRRARHLAEAQGSWSWSEALSLVVPVGIALYFIYKGAPDLSGDGLFGIVFLVSVIGGWQHRRLRARVDALTKLLTEAGYPGEA
jgi:hypothetical protein